MARTGRLGCSQLSWISMDGTSVCSGTLQVANKPQLRTAAAPTASVRSPVQRYSFQRMGWPRPRMTSNADRLSLCLGYLGDGDDTCSRCRSYCQETLVLRSETKQVQIRTHLLCLTDREPVNLARELYFWLGSVTLAALRGGNAVSVSEYLRPYATLLASWIWS